MNSTRLFRILICALVICSLLINCSPIRAKAVAVEASIAIGLIAMMILASAGVVYTASTTNQIQAIGNSFQTYMYQWGETENKLDQVESFFMLLPFYAGSGDGGDDDETPHEKQVRLARGILVGITAWVASIVLNNVKIEEEVGAAPEGYMYYNQYVYPVLPDIDFETYPYAYIVYDAGKTYLIFTKTPSSIKRETTNGLYFTDYGREPYTLSSAGESWNEGISGYPDGYSLRWCNYDMYFGDALYMPGSDPSSVLTEFFEPSTYVGDIPEQLQNGELEPEDIPLPDINLEPYIEDGKLAPQKVIDTMSNLSTGALPYDQFLQQSTLPPEIDDGGMDTDSGTSSDTWQPPSNPGQFALDLTKYFPFYIPFDLYDLFTCLNADPVAPVIHWELPIPGGSTYPIELDLSPFNSVAQLLRRMQLLLFCVGLAIKTRDLIKG